MLNVKTILGPFATPLIQFTIYSKRRCCTSAATGVMVLKYDNIFTLHEYKLLLAHTRTHRTLAIHFSISNYVYCLLFKQCYFLCIVVVVVPLARVPFDIFYLPDKFKLHANNDPS